MIKRKSKIKQWYLNYFDWNQDGETNWWEFTIPFLFVMAIEIIAELIGIFITSFF